MTEIELRVILRDWINEMGLTIIERGDAAEVLKASTALPIDVYDRAMTFSEKRLGLTLPTTVDAHDLLFEYASKIWLCGRIIAREVGDFDQGDKKASKVFDNAKAQREILRQDYEDLRKEVWGKGVSSRRSTTGDLEIASHSIVSDHETNIASETVLELEEG